jgi:hypothetical protein
MASKKKTSSEADASTTVTIELWGSLKIEGNMAGCKVSLSRPVLPGETVEECLTKLIATEGKALQSGVNKAFNHLGYDDVITEE